MSTKIPFVSAIVPVYNDFDLLQRCLDALSEQTYPTDAYEIIVVDNNSDEPIPEGILKNARTEVLHESKIGSYNARNRGLTSAKGDVLAFTDADCVPDSDWLSKGVQAITSEKNCGLVGGDIVVTVRDRSNPSLSESYESRYSFQQQIYVEKFRFAATANMFTTRLVMDEVGVFDSEFRSSGDREWGNRVADAGFLLLYSKQAVVRHPARYTYKQLLHKMLRVAGSEYLFEQQKRCQNRRTWTRWGSYATPPVSKVGRIITDRNITSLSRRVGLSMLVVALKYAALCERIRIAMGGTPRR